MFSSFHFELKTVRVRFRVDKDGTVNSLEIVASGGEDFDECAQ